MSQKNGRKRVLEETDYDLRRFGESLKCHEKYQKDAERLTSKVLQTLRSKSKYKLGKHDFGGSYGKNTDVIDPDLDIVVRVKNCQPPFEKVLNDFEKVLRSHEGYLQIRSGDYKKSKRSLNFFFTNGIPVDLLPAEDVKEDELDDLLGEMEENKQNAYYHGPALVEDQVGFLKSQNSFTHTVVRLSKFCFKSWYLGGESCRGGSAMMELIAVAAAEKELTKKYASEFQALRGVMVMLGNLDTLKLAFSRVDDEDDEHREWERVKPSELHRHNTKWLIPDVVGNRGILNRPCFIIDPANPFQDYLEDKSDEVIGKLKNFACTTRDRLDRLLKESKNNGEDDEFMRKLFRPIPKDLTKENDKSLSLPDDILLTCDERCNSIYNKVKIWNANIMEDLKVRQAVKVLKKNLITVVHSTVKGNPDDVTVDDVTDAVEELIENNLQTDLEDANQWEEHSDQFDVMIKIPYVIRGKGYAVCLSMAWD
ncbi:hypothetical protein Ocin01_11554 [Orchesella cincta]|uniref:Uncharacterized protein n=1 Tax=Orchesella cincta TaxID=48709 RepID=A0A1D2MPY5_ORCCI|nr:hypothetical protein Ocin01_11554 [Orchesella cincta]